VVEVRLDVDELIAASLLLEALLEELVTRPVTPHRVAARAFDEDTGSEAHPVLALVSFEIDQAQSLRAELLPLAVNSPLKKSIRRPSGRFVRALRR